MNPELELYKLVIRIAAEEAYLNEVLSKAGEYQNPKTDCYKASWLDKRISEWVEQAQRRRVANLTLDILTSTN